MAFEIQHHSTMLSDGVRLAAFRAALRETMRPTDRVVDIGTGTGILASYAALLTDAEVYGIEYFPEAASLAEKVVSGSGLRNISILNESSFTCELPAAPDVLVTETIGALGPEENIVELTRAFVARYPTVRRLIPARLTLCAVPVHAPAVDTIYQRFLRGFDAASHGSFNYQAIFDELDRHAGTQLFTTDLSGARVVGDEVILADYRLGRDARSDFAAAVRVSGRDANALHMFFRATLSEGQILTSFVGDPMTHWRHSFVRVPAAARELRMSYASATRRFRFNWGK